MPRLTVVISQGQSANPVKRKLEEDIVAALLFDKGLDVTVIPHLYDLAPDGTGMLCLQGLTGDVVVLSWMYPRAAHWILDRNGIKGQFGATLLVDEKSDDDLDEEERAAVAAAATDDKERVGPRNVPSRTIYCLDLRVRPQAQPFIDEVRRIAQEAATPVVNLLGWLNGTPKPEHVERLRSPTPGNVEHRANNGHANGNGNGVPHLPLESVPGTKQPNVIAESTNRRWYPVIDYTRCTNCMECIDFCLFGVYGLDKQQTILIEQPDNCRKGCPACSRVCPENAIIFPQHKSPGIAGGNEVAGSLKIDLSKLFGAPDGEFSVDLAVKERDEQLLLAGRDAVGTTVGLPKRQPDQPTAPKDELDDLLDQLDATGL